MKDQNKQKAEDLNHEMGISMIEESELASDLLCNSLHCS